MQATMNRALQKEYDTVLKPYGITKMHWLIIGTVLDAGREGIRLTELSQVINTTMSYVTTAVNLMESKGMIVRTDSEFDSRSKMISINESFAPKCAEIEASLRDSLRKTIYAKIDSIEFKIYMKVMHQLSSSTQE
jgi:DNA-binding MarR family transcriptional regulator